MQTRLFDLWCRLFHRPWHGPITSCEGTFWYCAVGHAIPCLEFPFHLSRRLPKVYYTPEPEPQLSGIERRAMEEELERMRQ